MYSVTITSRAERELKRLDRPAKNRIVTAILALGSDPGPPGCLKVKAKKVYGAFALASGVSVIR